MRIETLSRLLALTEISGVGDKRALQLYRSFNSFQDLFSAELDRFKEFHYIDRENIEELRNLDSTISVYEKLLQQCENDDIKIIGIEDPQYPKELREFHSPLIIYAKGNVDLLNRPSISFAGSRDTDSKGQKWAADVAEDLSEEYVIVSGGAKGADASAHEGALRAGGDTVVVLGTGIENMYPKENKQLFDRVLANNGLIISHQTPDTGPSRTGFLHRNKTNSGLSEGIVLIATDGSGGTMSQYRDAVSQEKQIFAPAAKLEIEPSKGIKEIIENGEAQSVTSAREILDDLEKDNEPPSDGQSALDNWT